MFDWSVSCVISSLKLTISLEWLNAMRPLDEIVYNICYSDALDMDYIKALIKQHNYTLVSVIKIHVEDGNVVMLDRILKITDNYWYVLQQILYYAAISEKIILNDFVRYLKMFIRCPNTAFVGIYRYNNEEIRKFCLELFKCSNSPNKTVGNIHTVKCYDTKIMPYHVNKEHLLATIEKFSQSEIESSNWKSTLMSW